MKLNQIHPNIKWRFVVGFLTHASYMMVAPFLVIYFASKVGASVTGVLYILIIISAIIGSFCGGYLSDRLGRIKVLFVTELAAASIFLVIALLNSPWYDAPYLTGIVFIFYTFFTGCFQPVTMALILDSSRPDTREEIFRINYWVNNLAIAIGSLIGGFLFMNHHFILFLIVAATSFISVVITVVFLTDEYKPKEGAQESVKKKGFPLMDVLKSYSLVFRDKVFLLFIVGSVLVLSLETQLTNYVGIRLAKVVPETNFFSFGDFQWSINGTELLGILRSENTILVVLGTFFITLLIKRLGEKQRFLGGAILYVCSFVAISIIKSPWLLIIVMLLATLGELIYVPIKQSILGKLAPDKSRSVYMAVHHSSMTLTEIIAGICIMISSFLSPSIMTRMFAIMGLIGLLCYFKFVRLKGIGLVENEDVKEGAG